MSFVVSLSAFDAFRDLISCGEGERVNARNQSCEAFALCTRFSAFNFFFVQLPVILDVTKLGLKYT